jgi:arsenite-transporting ATPase
MNGTGAWAWSIHLSNISAAASVTPPIIDPMTATLRDLFAHHLIFVGGKGGVGKTTTASALGLAAADEGRTCLLVSTDPAHSLGDIFDTTIGDTKTPLVDRVWGLEIDPDAEAAQHIKTVKLQMKQLVHPRFYDEIDRQLDLASHAPGASEAALLERVAELMGDGGNQFDVVIFDTAPSGHTVRLLSLPEVMRAWTDGLLRHRERSSRLASAFRHLGGGQIKGDDLSMIDSAQDYPDESLSERLNNVLETRRRKFLIARDRLLDTSATAFLLVVNPDKLSILESRKLVDRLRQFSMNVSAVVINRVLPDDVGEGGDFFAARYEQEKTYRREIAEVFNTLPKVVVPLLRHDVHGLESIRRIGRRLASGWTKA